MHIGLELESRRRIYEYLAANPGVHLRRIGQALGMSTGMLSYHLGVMEKLGLLKSETARHRRRYYPALVYREDQRRILALLRERVPRRVLVDLATHGGRRFADLLPAVRRPAANDRGVEVHPLVSPREARLHGRRDPRTSGSGERLYPAGRK